MAKKRPNQQEEAVIQELQPEDFDLIVNKASPEVELPEIVIDENKIKIPEAPEIIAPTASEILSAFPVNTINLPEREPATNEGKIIEFLKSRNTGQFIPINDFLKSLYPMPKMNEPKPWHKQHTMKTLKNTLETMVKAEEIALEGNRHLQLSRFYYPDNTGITHYYNLDTLPLKAKLA